MASNTDYPRLLQWNLKWKEFKMCAMQYQNKMIALLLVASGIGCTNPIAPSRNWSSIYESVTIPIESERPLLVRFVRHGEKDLEELRYVDITIEEKHYRLRISGAPHYDISIIKNGRLVSKNSRLDTEVITRHYGITNGKVPMEPEEWHKFVVNNGNPKLGLANGVVE